MLLRSIQAWISDSIEAATWEMEWVEARRVRKDLRVWWPWDLWRVSTRALRSERCWERAERFGSLERMASDSVSSSSRALMAEDEFNSDELGLGCACNWCEACNWFPQVRTWGNQLLPWWTQKCT
ncbi:hypothetical protein FH972_001107 [Carpinus fangiana]|uniref:Uncharacterized protein n=1 Tax=Carpinus fangiana TaxID=176857 RepID=A0A5N6QAX6_9ROSI|nr:hypothetical protein FH972_001107 [Carpinus fangiana]